MHFCLLLFQVLILFVALGVFLLKIREIFVENPLVDVRELKKIFLIIGGLCDPVFMSFSRHCSEHLKKNCSLESKPHRNCTVLTDSSSTEISDHLDSTKQILYKILVALARVFSPSFYMSILEKRLSHK